MREGPVATGLALVLLFSLGLLDAPGAAGDPRCDGVTARVVGTQGDDVIRLPKRGRHTVVSRGGDDLIVTFAGRDRICAGKGDDTVLAGPQPDLVVAGGGDDLIYGGAGRDRVRARAGRDSVFGDAGSDDLRGGRGADRVVGGLVDDIVRGGPGDDLVAGGHGGDGVAGDGGDDWLRGGASRDGFFGGPGSDTVSFATATPTNSPGGRGGVTVDLGRRLASGEGPRERVEEVENVLGSPFADTLIGAGGANHLDGGYGDDRLDGGGGDDSSAGGPGSDSCSDFQSADSSCNDSDPRPAAAVVAVDRRRLDAGLLVLGRQGEAPDRIRVEASRSEVRVSASTPVIPGEGCTSSAGAIRCLGDPHRLRYVSIVGLEGDDRLASGGLLPGRGEVQLDGGTGSDALIGGDADDVLIGGLSGRDRLRGGRSNDALISGAGRDALYGGPGNDQLVTNLPCDGHLFDGGRGAGDIAGFARAARARLRARIGGKAIDRRKARCRATRIRPDNEVLEGTRNRDVLIGTPDADPLIIGGPGSDRLEGRGGGDVLNGEEGRDAYFGGGGHDRLQAKDRRRDLRLDCGSGSGHVQRDSFDPEPTRCR